MASLLTHPIVPLTAAALVARSVVPWPLVTLGVVFALLPDVDGIAFRLGIPYASPFGHRGFSHSLVVAAFFAALAVPFARTFNARRFFSARGWEVFQSELIWVWTPLLLLALLGYLVRSRFATCASR